jgi:hypothetical protein
MAHTLYDLLFQLKGLVHFDVDVLRKTNDKGEEKPGIRVQFNTLACMVCNDADDANNSTKLLNMVLSRAVLPYTERRKSGIISVLIGPLTREGMLVALKHQVGIEQAASPAFHMQKHINDKYVVVPHMDWGIDVEQEDLLQCAIDMVRIPVRTIIEIRQKALQTAIANLLKAADE